MRLQSEKSCDINILNRTHERKMRGGRKMLSAKERELKNLKIRKRKESAEQEEAEKTAAAEQEEAEKTAESAEQEEAEKTEESAETEINKLEETEKQLDEYKLEYAKGLLESAGFGGDNYHALTMLDMTSRETIEEDVNRLVEIAKSFNTGEYASDSILPKTQNRKLSNDEIMRKTFGI